MKAVFDTFAQMAVMGAYAQGYRIECRPRGKRDAQWQECTPVWNWEKFEYRTINRFAKIK